VTRMGKQPGEGPGPQKMRPTLRLPELCKTNGRSGLRQVGREGATEQPSTKVERLTQPWLVRQSEPLSRP
jgi:hypothetical protein